MSQTNRGSWCCFNVRIDGEAFIFAFGFLIREGTLVCLSLEEKSVQCIQEICLFHSFFVNWPGELKSPNR